MIEFVNAKINIGLNVVNRRDDGYHNLETIFYPVGKVVGSTYDFNHFCDILEIIPTSQDDEQLINLGNKVDCPTEKNLIWKAYQAYRKACNNQLPPMKIIVSKHLPDQAGMGGGSADASFTLKILNKLNNDKFSDTQLSEIALSLGADCPFFIYNKPCYASGIGELIEPISLDLTGLSLLIVKPAISISTKEAFSHITPRPADFDLRQITQLPISKWKEVIHNDFEHSMFALHPEIKTIKQELYEYGATYASMTGSGSAFYAIFDDKQSAQQALLASQCPFKTLIEL